MQNPTRFSNSYYRLMLSLKWREKTLPNGVKQFVHYDEDLEQELMMLPTDLVLTNDKGFRPWVELYAKDKERFYKDFSAVFAKLCELGIQRDADGKVTNIDNERGGYKSAPKKSSTPGKKEEVGDGEAAPLKRENKAFQARL